MFLCVSDDKFASLAAFGSAVVHISFQCLAFAFLYYFFCGVSVTLDINTTSLSVETRSVGQQVLIVLQELL